MVFAPATSLTTITQCIGEGKDANREGIWGGELNDLLHAGKCFGQITGKYTTDPSYPFDPLHTPGSRKREVSLNVMDYDSSSKWIGSHTAWVPDPVK